MMVELDNVCFAYNRYKSLFVDVCLKVEAGHVYGLLGRNGTGKTTLLKLITSALKPSNGSCFVFGFNSIDRSPEMLELFFYVPEAFTMPSIYIQEFIDCFAPLYPNFDREYMQHYMNESELPQKNKLSNLSHGQQKTFAIGFGLACKTPLLILDEPTNGLDIPAKSHFRKTLIDSFQEDRSIIISTHQVKDINNLVDQVVILDHGEIFCNESIEHLSRKFSLVQDRTMEPYDVVYSESVYGIHNMLVANKEGEMGGDVDLELFFNATIHARERLKAVLMS